MYEINLKSTPLISIAMATYNGEKYLEEQLDSIYAQTYKNIEVIVTDDCSTDNTKDILENYAERYGLKYYINEKNLGFVKNFEKAVSLCKGEYIALSDQDDIWMPKKLSVLLKNIGTYDIICSDAVLINQEGERISDSLNQIANNQAESDPSFIRLLVGSFVLGCTVLMTKNLVEIAHPIPKNAKFHDWWYAMAATSHKGIGYIDSTLIYYRQHDANVHGAKIGAKDKSLFLHMKNMFTAAHKSEYKKNLLSAKIRIESYYESNFFPEKYDKVLKDYIEYFDDRLHGYIHIKAFILSIKYRKYLFRHEKVYRVWLKCFRVLVG